MTKDEALKEIIRDARREKMSLASYKRVSRALKALELDGGQQVRALAELGYVRRDTYAPYEWLAKKLYPQPDVAAW